MNVTSHYTGNELTTVYAVEGVCLPMLKTVIIYFSYLTTFP